MEITDDPIRGRLDGVNIPSYERILTIGLGIAGAGLGVTAAILGSRRAGIIGGVIAAVGAGLIARGTSGRCPAYRAMAQRAAREQDERDVASLRGAGAFTRQGVRDLDHGAPTRKNQGEGDRRSARAYNEHVRDFIEDDRVEPAARSAAIAVEGPEGAQLREAEEAGKAPARTKPGIH